MSLINTMLAGLEERQAYLSEGRDLVLDGLTSVNDDNFHHRRKKTPASVKLSLFLLLCVIVSLSTYRYYPVTGAASENGAGINVTGSDRQPAIAARVETAIEQAVDTTGIPAEQQTAESRISLKMDYKIPVANEPLPEPPAPSLAVAGQPAAEPAIASVPGTAAVTAPAAEAISATATAPAPPIDTINWTATEPAILGYDVSFMEGLGAVVKLELNEIADYRLYELDKPFRVVAEFDKFMQLPQGLPANFDHGVVSRIRGHHINRNKTMIVFDLFEKGVVQLAETGDFDTGFDLTIYISPADQAAVMSVAAAGEGSDPAADYPAVEEVYKPKAGSLSVTRNTRTPDQLLGRGLTDYHKGRRKEGLDQITKALEIEPRHVQARSTLTNLMITQNNFSRAIELLDAGILLRPEQYDWQKLKAKLLVKLNRQEEAIETLNRSGPDMNSDPDYYAFLAALLQQQGRNEEAVVYYQNVVAARADNGVWWMGLGISLERVGQAGRAADAYRNAIADNSLSPDIRNYIKNRLSIISGQ